MRSGPRDTACRLCRSAHRTARPLLPPARRRCTGRNPHSLSQFRWRRTRSDSRLLLLGTGREEEKKTGIPRGETQGKPLGPTKFRDNASYWNWLSTMEVSTYECGEEEGQSQPDGQEGISPARQPAAGGRVSCREARIFQEVEENHYLVPRLR